MSSPLEDALTGRFGRPLRHLASVDSSNSEALRWLQEEPPAPEGAVVVADDQSAGRGRWDREWLSSPGSSLLFSLVLRPAWETDRLGLLTVAAGLACAEGLSEVTGIEARLKWPNDIMLSSRKVGGVLIETRVSGHRVDAVVVGIGVNLDLPEDDLPPEIAERATSVHAEVRRAGGSPPERPRVLSAILARLETVVKALESEAARKSVTKRTVELMDIFGREVDLRFADGRVERAIARGLLEDGSLEVETLEGTHPVQAAEIERVREAP
jgi:BirA family biotin operon repressor/biotin-[acetyl-CoA-carboxylase] ligase